MPTQSRSILVIRGGKDDGRKRVGLPTANLWHGEPHGSSLTRLSICCGPHYLLFLIPKLPTEYGATSFSVKNADAFACSKYIHVSWYLVLLCINIMSKQRKIIVCSPFMSRCNGTQGQTADWRARWRCLPRQPPAGGLISKRSFV